MTIEIDKFKNVIDTYDGRLVAGAEDLASGHQSAFRRLLSIITGARQEQNKAVYKVFSEALELEFGAFGTNALSSLKLKDGSKLSAANVRQVLKDAEAAKFQYAQFGIDLNDKTQIRSFSDAALCNKEGEETAALPENPTAPGVRVDYKKTDGSLFQGRFKEELKKVEPALVAGTGIPTSNPGFGQRSIACDRLNRKLGLKVIASAEFGLHNGHLGVVEARRPGCPLMMKNHEFEITSECGNKRLWYLTEACQELKDKPEELQELGKTQGLLGLRFEQGRLMACADVSIGMDVCDKVLLKEMNDLQWFDALCGRVGRGSGDYLVHYSTEGKVIRVTGVQNGLSFGSALHDPKNLPGALAGASKNCGLPGVISEETALALLNMTEDHIAAELRGLLTADEIAACQDRLRVIQKQIYGMDVGTTRILSNQQRKKDRDDHVSQHGNDEEYVDHGGWEQSTKAVLDYMSNEESSYLGRDRDAGKALVRIFPRDVNWTRC